MMYIFCRIDKRRTERDVGRGVAVRIRRVGDKAKARGMWDECTAEGEGGEEVENVKT
jgi:hypothetical protein